MVKQLETHDQVHSPLIIAGNLSPDFSKERSRTSAIHAWFKSLELAFPLIVWS